MTGAQRVLAIHALDTGAGEGLVADAGVIGDLEGSAACVASSIVFPEPVSLELLSRQLTRATAAPVSAMRVGYLRGRAHVELVASVLRRVAGETSVVAIPQRQDDGAALDADTHAAIVDHLFPAARVVICRAADLLSGPGNDGNDADRLTEILASVRSQGARAAIVSGYLLGGRVLDALDDGGDVLLLDTARIQGPRVPGLAGAYASAVATHLARGASLAHAAEAAQRYVGFRIQRGR